MDPMGSFKGTFREACWQMIDTILEIGLLVPSFLGRGPYTNTMDDLGYKAGIQEEILYITYRTQMGPHILEDLTLKCPQKTRSVGF